jgi:hypothetical protein
MTGALIITLLYFCVVVGVTFYVLTLLNRFVAAHERIADAQAQIASKFRADGEA